jgi:methionyl-tRNA formyltransferase
MKKIVLFINGELGLKVLRFVISQKKTEISGIVLNSIQKRSSFYLDKINIVLREYGKKILILSYENTINSNQYLKEILNISDYGISALFGHVLPWTLLENSGCEIINLHPSLLPIGRGADPIPWSIIDQQKQGITIHIINSGLDTGAILSQKEIKTNFGMNSGEIYEIATNMLITELESIFYTWTNRSIKVLGQSEFSGSIHKSKELESIRVMKSDELGTFGEFLRKLQALTFSDGRKPLFIDDSGKLWQINISLSPFREEI